MPKIPLMQSGRLDHTRAAAPVSHLLDSNYGMEGHRQLGHLAGIIGKSGETIGNAISRVTSAYADFEAAKTDIENRIAAVDDRNLFAFHQKSLEDRLAANPGASDEEKQSWIDQTDRDYAEARKDVVSRMSENFRRLHDAAMTGERQSAARRRENLLIQGASTRAQNTALTQIDTALRNNNLDLANEILAMHEGKTISADLARKLRDDFPRLAQSYAAQARVAADDPRILEELEEKNADGSFAKFPDITPDYRAKLTHSARQNKARFLADNHLAWLAQRNAEGNFPSEKDVVESFKRGEINKEQLQLRLPVARRNDERIAEEKFREWVANVSSGEIDAPSLQELKERYRRGEIDDRDFLRMLPVVKRMEEQRENREIAQYAIDAADGRMLSKNEIDAMLADGTISREKALRLTKINEETAAARRRNEKGIAELNENKLLGWIYTMPRPRQSEYATSRAAAFARIRQYFPGDSYRQEKLMQALDKHWKHDVLDDTDTGQNVRKWCIDTMRKFGLDDSKNAVPDADLVQLRIELFDEARRLCDGKRTYGDIVERLEKLSKMRIEGKIKRMFNPASGMTVDLDKFGKVWDSRITGGSWRVELPGSALFAYEKGRKALAQKKNAEGWIDRAEIARSDVEKGRTVWILKDGRRIFADEYEDQEQKTIK